MSSIKQYFLDLKIGTQGFFDLEVEPHNSLGSCTEFLFYSLEGAMFNYLPYWSNFF